MENIKYIKQTVEVAEHSFYCDDCGEYLGTSEEHDDGWYYPLGDFELKFYVVDDWYRIKKCLCKNCRKSFVSDVKVKLMNMGFKVY